jgi:hypothetical protein
VRTSPRRAIRLDGQICRRDFIDARRPIRCCRVERHTCELKDWFVVSCRPLEFFAFFILKVADDAQLLDCLTHDFGNMLKPIVNRRELFFDHALELAESFEQLAGVVAFEGAIGHKGLDCPSRGRLARDCTRPACAGTLMCMAEKPRKRRDRYDNSGNTEDQYLDDSRTVMVNKLGITDLDALQTAEEQGLARAYGQLLREVRTDSPMTCDLVRHIHATIFGDLYDWAGRWRTVWISKPGITWPPPDYLGQAMDEFERTVLSRWPAGAIHDDATFCQAAGEIQGEF